MTEEEFDAFRTTKRLDPVALHRTVIERLAQLLTDNARVQGIFNVREASNDMKTAAMDIKHAVDLAFSEHKIKV